VQLFAYRHVNFALLFVEVIRALRAVHSLPPEAAQLAPQLGGFGYVVVEEQIALVDRRTRKVRPYFRDGVAGNEIVRATLTIVARRLA
jgi:hypothetical protein